MALINNKAKEGPRPQDTWILGSKYSANRRADIRRHTNSILRCSYRTNFPPLAPYHYSSDAGWGCMLRSAQSLMAQALQRHTLGREWRAPEDLERRREIKEYCEILQWFTDYPGPPSVYSIHHLVQCGMRYDKLPGEWYGPGTAALVLRDLAKLHHRKYRGPLEVYVCQGDAVFISEVEKYASTATDSLKRPDREREGPGAGSGSVNGSMSSSNWRDFGSVSSSPSESPLYSITARSFNLSASPNHSPQHNMMGKVTVINDSGSTPAAVEPDSVAGTAPVMEGDTTTSDIKDSVSDRKAVSIVQETESTATSVAPVLHDSTSEYTPVESQLNSVSDEPADSSRTSAAMSVAPDTAVCSEHEGTEQNAVDPALPPAPVMVGIASDQTIQTAELSAIHSEYDVDQSVSDAERTEGESRDIHSSEYSRDHEISNSNAAQTSTLEKSEPSEESAVSVPSDSQSHITPSQSSLDPPSLPDTGIPVLSGAVMSKDSTEQIEATSQEQVTPERLHTDPDSDTDAGARDAPDSPFERVHNPFYDPLLNPPPSSQKQRPWSCGLMLLIPLRLGINHINAEYFDELKEVLQSRYTLGILGGRPKHAIYFVGHRGDLLLGLDPHVVHPNPSLSAPFPSTEYMSQMHVSEFQCLDVTMLDPSVALAFYFRDREEFEAFCESTRVSVEQKKQAGRRYLFSVQHSKPSYENAGDGDWGQSDGEGSGDDDEYVFL